MNKIEYQERERIYRDAIRTYGGEAQTLMVIEEASELIKELCKTWRPGGTTTEKIAEECADLTIMLEQLRLIFDFNDAVCEIMDTKVQRLAERLKKSHEEAEKNCFLADEDF